MKKLRLTFLSVLLLFSCNLFAQSPGGIENPSIWLKGNFSPDANSANRIAELNFNPAVALDKSDTRIKLDDNAEALRRATIFTVYLDKNSDKEKQVWEMTGSFGDLSLSTERVSSKSGKTNIPFQKNKPKARAIIHTYSSHVAGCNSKSSFNKESSIQFGSANSDASPDNSLKLISEFILYKKLLNEQETTKIETYLALKYGITLEKNYLNALGETVWNSDNDAGFSNNIAGIARDDQSSLLQKQGTSCTAPEQLVIGVNKIVQSNSENAGQINDGDYLIWGDNAQSFKLRPNVKDGANEIMLSEKKWLMKASGNTANKISTEIKIDTKAFFPGNSSKESIYLVINRSGTDDFAKENCIYITPDNISTDGIATFANIFWDTDGNGKDNFTFGFKSDINSSRQQMVASVNGEPSPANFEVFPNPVSDGNYQVAINLVQPADIQIKIYNLSHQLISSTVASGQASYLLSGHIDGPSAAYIIQLITPQEELYRMIILQ